MEEPGDGRLPRSGVAFTWRPQGVVSFPLEHPHMSRLHLTPLLLAAFFPGLAEAQDPFTASQRWLTAPSAADWAPEQVAFAGDEAFVWCSVRGAEDSLLLMDSVSTGDGVIRGTVPPLADQFRAAAIAAGSRADRVFAMRQVSLPSLFRRTPLVSGFNALAASGGAPMDEVWTHDLGIRINSSVKLVTDARGDVVAAAAFNDATAEVRLDLLDGTTGALLGRADVPGVGLNALSISADGRRVILSAGMNLFVLDAAGRTLHVEPLALATQAVSASADGGTVAYGTFGAVRLLTEFPGFGYMATGSVWGGATELPTRLDLSRDGTIAAIGWWEYTSGRSVRLEIFDLLFQFPMASHDVPGSTGASQNLVSDVEFSGDDRRAAFATWGNGSAPEVYLLEMGAFGPVLRVDTGGSVRDLDLDNSGTRLALASKSVHASAPSARGDLRLLDSGERQIQLLETPRLGGELRAAARRPGATIGWFLIGPRAAQPTQLPGVDGPLLLRRDRLQFQVAVPDASGRMDLVLPVPGSSTLRGTQMHLQGAFRVPGGVALTRNLVSPYLLD